jgi:diguanylate cyclase (GGDEF)-like protein
MRRTEFQSIDTRSLTDIIGEPRNKNFDLISISVGVALYPQDGTSSADLLGSADEALYFAKRAGRDRVVLSASGSPVTA